MIMSTETLTSDAETSSISVTTIPETSENFTAIEPDVRVSAWLYFLLGWIVLMVILFLVLFYLYIKAKPNSKPSSYANFNDVADGYKLEPDAGMISVLTLSDDEVPDITLQCFE